MRINEEIDALEVIGVPDRGVPRRGATPAPEPIGSRLRTGTWQGAIDTRHGKPP